LEKLVIDSNFWKNRSVFITGHTGFKGGWLSFWLSEVGAKVHGFSLEPPTTPNFFTETNLEKRLSSSTIGDILNFNNLKCTLEQATPDVLFHLAAQPLVRESYSSPLATLETNVMGTATVLQAARSVSSIKAIVNITTDKCYENKEWHWPYRENDHLGGYDPYSASKACAEIITSAYRNSFLSDSNVNLASVRAGNVISGGDWAADRLIPDFFRASDAGESLNVRYPKAIRPWQHVLEPLSGYLILAEKLYNGGIAFAEAWNFGPDEEDSRSVGWIIERLCSQIEGSKWASDNSTQPHEASLLKLDSSKAKAMLGWSPRWNLETALTKTADWHKAWKCEEDMGSITSMQINNYLQS
jgi:CDP-glucose 4,6-dehydratase